MVSWRCLRLGGWDEQRTDHIHEKIISDGYQEMIS